MNPNTPIWEPNAATDLSRAFDQHCRRYQGQRGLVPGSVESGWLNALRDRALRTRDQKLEQITDSLLALLANPSASTDFSKDFTVIYEESLRLAYPLSRALLDEHHFHSGITWDYTLNHIDLGQVRRFEDEALSDQSMKAFVTDMRSTLKQTSTRPRHEVYRSFFEVYSEALVCSLLRERCDGKLHITKIPESATPGPDFECELDIDRPTKTKTLVFYIEVKSLDIVHAPQRLPEMLDEGMNRQIEIDRQLAKGRKVATATGEIAPHRGYGDDPNYDPGSVRQAIENISSKVVGNFKSPQFKRGPTFALANILRLGLPGQGVGTLTPSFYDPTPSGACESGALWHIAFGEVDTPIYKRPEFEGKGTIDGKLRREGLLVSNSLGTPGLIALHYDDGYRFDGFYDASWKSEEWGWSNLQTEEVLYALCGDFNDRRNSYAHEYSHFHRRRPE